MINETYSAFVQGSMPTLARPEVDVLDGLTTTIIVDQERMGANARSTVGTATDANAMLHGRPRRAAGSDALSQPCPCHARVRPWTAMPLRTAS
jgi:excinuclease UvrABC ATPase subunit